jgi:arylsulfatase
MPGGEDTYMSYDLPWANASNTPFRYFKHWVHEGGISTPMIVSWPAKIQRPGSIHTAPVHVVDLLPTFADLSGSAYPSAYRGQAVQPTEGESFAAAFTQGEWSRKRPIFWEHEGNCAVRDGKWKLVKRYPGDWELYDMDADRTELHDLAQQNPAIVDRMKSGYAAWADRCKVRPWGDKGKPVFN